MNEGKNMSTDKHEFGPLPCPDVADWCGQFSGYSAQRMAAYTASEVAKAVASKRAVAAERDLAVELLRDCEQALADTAGAPWWPARAALRTKVRLALGMDAPDGA